MSCLPNLKGEFSGNKPCTLRGPDTRSERPPRGHRPATLQPSGLATKRAPGVIADALPRPARSGNGPPRPPPGAHGCPPGPERRGLGARRRRGEGCGRAPGDGARRPGPGQSPRLLTFSVSRSFTVGSGVLVDILLHFTSAQREGETKQRGPGGRRSGVEGPAVPERRRGRAAPLPHGRLDPGSGPGRPPAGRGAHAPPAPAAAPRSPAGGGGGAGPAAAGCGSAHWRPRASGRPAGPDPLASSSAPARRAADFSAGASTQRRRRPLKKRRMWRRWSARQVPAGCGRRPWMGLRRRRLHPAVLLPPARFPPQPPPSGHRHRRPQHLRASRTQDGRPSASFAASGCRK